MTGSEVVVLGRLADPYGIRGWVRLHAFGDDPLAWAEMPVWWLSGDGKGWQEKKLKSLRAHGDGVVVLFEGIADRNGAEALKGMLVGAPRESLPATDEDEYYWADLIGLNVVNVQDQPLGQVSKLLETGAHDVLVVQDGEQERLLPFVDHVVKSVDLAAGCIRVDWGPDW